LPDDVLDFVAGQLTIADRGRKAVHRAGETKPDHQQEIRRACGLRDFAEAEAELTGWVAAWLRERKVLLPGVTTLTHLQARNLGERDGRGSVLGSLSRKPHTMP
jgi:hypothetical protein